MKRKYLENDNPCNLNNIQCDEIIFDKQTIISK